MKARNPDESNVIIAITPFGRPNSRLAVGAARAGALAVLDLGTNAVAAENELAAVTRFWAGEFGVRVGRNCAVSPGDLPEQVTSVILASDADSSVDWTVGRSVIAEVTSRDEAHAAVKAGASGLIARGWESGGRVSEITTFVLLQQLLAEVTVPVWAAGGIGRHSAAAAVAGGATGVVLDTQLALTAEVELPHQIAAAIRAMDGSETKIIGGYRVFVRPDLPLAKLADRIVPPTSDEVYALLGSDNLRTQLLPVGQDGPIAAQFARDFVTAGSVIQAVRESIRTSIIDADEAQPLASGRFSADHGLDVPIAQGPMTHVSDSAKFSAAVANAGGLPFTAMQLITGDKAREMLLSTAAELDGRPWGAGILGFVPPEIRESQLAAIHEARPPFALIAGGRPSQAAELEAEGIATYLHVPSPGLLDQFLAQGARRFVFEGGECGGHVGPRSSFVLWDAQVERLLKFGAKAGDSFFEGLHLLFAGGIHDERSAAMVAALAAPLEARGAGIGVLMGTAYLFTTELVAAQAVQPSFQEAAIECDTTVLLETSPGHQTRCADTDYVRDFLSTKQRLIDDGATRQEMWAELEQLNLGRLRIAAKGLRREGDHIVEVDESVQRAEGMVMIGEIATMRAATTTVARLHDQVTTGATAFLRTRAQELGYTEPATETEHQSLDIAIVGMAGMFADAPNVDSFWANVLDGLDSVTEVSPERWDPAIYFDDTTMGPTSGTTPSKWGGFLPDIPFDALKYGIPPASLASIEPVQLLSLEVAAQALRDAGYRAIADDSGREFDRARASVVFGTEPGTELAAAYGFKAALPSFLPEIPAPLDEHLPDLTEDSFPGVLGNVIAGRIANRLDLRGLNFTVDAACASSLAALDSACKELAAGTSDIVLCGGADTHNSVADYLLFASVGALSPSGRCRTFDSTADGIAIGEGAACVVLKRLADAERDGDRIYSVVKGVGGSSDGRSLGLTAPRAEGQRLAMDRAYRSAGISPAKINLVEAHGTGTVVGDRTEIATLTKLFEESGATAGSVSLGSVKSQIGHTKCASGMASIIKAAKALHTGVRPPTAQLNAPNAVWEPGVSPFYFDSAARPWLAETSDRIAGISSFGFGGTNFHAVLSAYDGAPDPLHGRDEWPAELFLLRGADRSTAETSLRRLRELSVANDGAGRPWRLRDIARTHSESTSSAPVQAAIVARDLDDLNVKLEALRSWDSDLEGVFIASGTEAGSTAFLFPGQGSQRVGMLADLFVAFPPLHRYLTLGSQWYDAMYPPAAFTIEDVAAQRAALTNTAVAQPALGVAELAMNDLLTTLGISPDVAAGHSYGELVALRAAGALTDEDLLSLSEDRGQAVLSAAPQDDPGSMLAVKGTAEAVREVLAATPELADVILTNHNAPQQSTLSGPTQAVAKAVELFREKGFSATHLQVGCAFHSPMIAQARGILAGHLEDTPISSPSIPVWSNTTAQPYPTEPDQIRALLAKQVAEPVHFLDQIENMYAAGVRTFVEVGPGQVLTHLVTQILDDRPHTAVATDTGSEPGITSLLNALAQLAVNGTEVEMSPLFRGRDARSVSATSIPRKPGWVVNGFTTRTAAGEFLPGGFRPANQFERHTMVLGGAMASNRDELVREFLRSTREMVAAQRDVMLSYLGTAPTPSTIIDSPLSSLPEMAALTATPPVTNGTAAASVAPEPEIELTSEHAMDLVRGIVSERTGYPEDMLESDLDLEADLSIDSIKRTEILGALRDKLSFLADGDNAVDEAAVEELARLKTLNGIVGWLMQRASGESDGASSPSANGDLDDADTDRGSTQRFVVVSESIPAPMNSLDLVADRSVVVVKSGTELDGVLADLLEGHGATVTVVDQADDLSTLDNGTSTVIYLPGLGGGAVLPDGYGALRTIATAGIREVLIASGFGGNFGHAANASDAAGLGLLGFTRTAAREFPKTVIRAVDLDPAEEPKLLATALVSELVDAAADAPVVVGRTADDRRRLTVVAAPLVDAALDEGAAELDLAADSVVLLTGGARGITAQVAIGLAQRSGCHVELLGRTPLPTAPEDAAFTDAADAIALRRVVIDQGVRIPAEIEAVVSRVLAERELRSTISELESHGSSVKYHVVDVRDANAVTAVVDSIYERHERLDAVIHGAGVLDDKLITDKSQDSFRNVYSTKVDGARNVINAVKGDLKYVVLFGSVSGVFGNRGQADYSAANDSLDTLAHAWASKFSGRVVSADWGPWAPTGGGMVSDQLMREYAKRGIGVIDHADGVASLLRELTHPAAVEPQVVFFNGSVEAFGG